MAVLAYNEILPKKIINYNDAPFEVLSAHIFRMQKRKPVNQTRLRNMVTGSVLEISFHSSETATEADTERMDAIYLYSNGKESWFAEDGNPKNRFSFPFENVREQVQWLAQNTPVEVLTYDEKPMTIKIPVKVDLEVKDAPPAVKGNTVSGGTKLATLSTGAKVNVPLFINPGDIVRINTDSGEYTERMEKA
jgi:elongation factor P